MNERRRSLGEEGSQERPLNVEGCMDVDLPELSSLSLTDNLTSVDHWSRDSYSDRSGRFESGLCENMSHVTIIEDDVNSNIVTPRFDSHDVYHVTLPAADDNGMYIDTNSDLVLTGTYIDEGYNSKSMSLTERLPFQETDSSDCVTPPTSQDVFSVYSQDGDGDTSLHIGIIQQETSLVQTFINMAPSSDWLNICNHLLQTPLHLAVITRQLKVVRRLMTAGARVDVSDIHGNTPLHIACREGYVEIVQCLLCAVYHKETLLNNYEISYQRIPQDLNKRNCDGLTCLHLAAMCTNLRIIELLLNNGADINIRDGTSGRTVLHRGAETGNRILLHFLLSQRHLDVCCETFGGLTPLRLAAGRGFNDIVRVLLAHGAGVQDDEDSDSSDEDTFGFNPGNNQTVSTCV